MALYAIGDLHLSLGPADKPMDVFGGRWTGYMEKLRENLKVIGPEDTTVLLGDLSWAMSLDDAAEDFSFMNAIPGRKIILKGNHDYWWTTLRAFDRFCAEHGFADFHVLNNSCFFYGDIALCGTPRKQKGGIPYEADDPDPKAAFGPRGAVHGAERVRTRLCGCDRP